MHVMALAVDTPGFMRRLVGLLDGRHYKVHSLVLGKAGHAEAGEGEGKPMVRVNLVVNEPPARAQRLARHLARIVDVVSVGVATSNEAAARELALIKVRVGPQGRSEILAIAQVFRAQVVDAAPRSVTIEATGASDKIDALITVLAEHGIEEVARTGSVALQRGEAMLGGAYIRGVGEAGSELAATGTAD